MTREIKGIAIILVIYLIGEIISRLVGGFMPGSVIGMLLLFGLLQCGVVKEEDIKGVCNFILSNMMMLFLPITVGLMVSVEMLKEGWMEAIAAMIISTVIVMIVVGFIQQIIGKRWRR